MATSDLNSLPAQLLAIAARCKPLAKRLKQAKGTFDHVTEAAQPFLLALLAQAKARRVWAICENVRAQEQLFSDLPNWHAPVLFLPELEMAALSNAIPDPQISGERLEALERIATTDEPLLIVATRDSLDDSVTAPGALRKGRTEIRPGDTLDLQRFLPQLSDSGYERVAQVAVRGQFALRGGILDLYSPQQSLPVRIELFGDTVESVREFDPDQQTSVRTLEVCAVFLGDFESEMCPLSDYIRPGDLCIALDREGNAPIHILADSEDSEVEDFSLAFFEPEAAEFEAGDFVIQEAKRHQFLSQLKAWIAEQWTVAIFCNNEGEMERLRDLLGQSLPGEISFALGSLSRGFTFPAAKLAVLSDAEIFGRYRNPSARRLLRRATRLQGARAQIDFSELVEGDLVVHLEHGIGRFRCLRSFPATNGIAQEVLEIEFAEDSRLYVPLEHAYLVSRYVGLGRSSPTLSTLGNERWGKARQAAERAVFDYAGKLLSINAERATAIGFACPPDTRWQREFEASFLYTETPDQIRAIDETKLDMESERPMDRLICGDVGFGKTEVAIRAAFKAVAGGRQVAILVPTTVLAQQHFQTFRERMSDYPFTIEMLSRFRTAAEQRKVVEGMREGSVDIVIGTHRLISKDIAFKNLGLVVVDEEQRFGVAHKERFKAMFRLVDVLTLSATPIPRTLYLALMGARDMSTLETPPANRLPVETAICGYDERIIRDAINREIARQGQVYFLHNRVHDIEQVRERILHLCPGVKVDIGHGQMHEDELEVVMHRFVRGETSVLVSTTIIESGLDIPNANTIIIDRADRFGLADLYQLRGRVGRAQHKAYAYLMLPRDMVDGGDARRRINAIKQYSSLGAGFKIAMRDLEIRGAGNILGTAQSGHVAAVGFDLYCQLLKQAVAKLKGEGAPRRADVPLALDFVATSETQALANPDAAPAFLPQTFVHDPTARIHAYRDLAQAVSQKEIDATRKAWRDRFGPIPNEAANLLTVAEIRVAAASRQIARLETRKEKLMITRGGGYILVDGKFPRLRNGQDAEALKEILALLRSL